MVFSATVVDDQVKDGLPLVREMLSLLNTNANSVLPHLSQSVLDRWIRGHTAQSPLVRAMLNVAGPTVVRPDALAPVLEAVLMAFFCDDDEDVVPQDAEADLGTKAHTPGADIWSSIISDLSLPTDQNRVRALLERSVGEGHCLLLYAYLRLRLPKCLDIKEESVVIKSVMDWLRHLKMRYVDKICEK
jgi:hypothetical protein